MAEIALGIGTSHSPMLSTPYEAFAGLTELDRQGNSRSRGGGRFSTDYVPCYRSAAGTGVGMAFAAWR